MIRSVTSPESIISPPSYNNCHQYSLDRSQTSEWQTDYGMFSSIDDLYNNYDAHNVILDSSDRAQTFEIKSKMSNKLELVKVYKSVKTDAFSDIVRCTLNPSNHQTYYDSKTQNIYIRQPIYSISLFEQIKTKAINTFNDEKAVKPIIGALLNRIRDIHDRGFIHGNINPNDIAKYECNNKTVWNLTNFNSIQKCKTEGMYVGTPGWSAPEMSPWIKTVQTKRNKRKLNKYLNSSDIFSLGLVILFTLFGEQPFQISEETQRNYGQNVETLSEYCKQDLKEKMHKRWYSKLVKSEYMLKNYLIQLYYHNKISLALFELLYVGMLEYNPEKRWDYQQIYKSPWFVDVRHSDNKKKVQKLKIIINA